MLKFNGNQRYATTAITASILREISAKCNIPLQVQYLDSNSNQHGCCNDLIIYSLKCVNLTD